MNNESSKRVIYLADKIESCKNDTLKTFVANALVDELEQLRKTNIENVFKFAREYGIRFIYIGKGEISGCEGVDLGTWPAIWRVCDRAGISAGCGNRDQHQTTDFKGMLFPDGYYGAWDLSTNIKLSDVETEKKNFRRVVTRAKAKEYN